MIHSDGGAIADACHGAGSDRGGMQRRRHTRAESKRPRLRAIVPIARRDTRSHRGHLSLSAPDAEPSRQILLQEPTRGRMVRVAPDESSIGWMDAKKADEASGFR